MPGECLIFIAMLEAEQLQQCKEVFLRLVAQRVLYKPLVELVFELVESYFDLELLNY